MAACASDPTSAPVAAVSRAAPASWTLTSAPRVLTAPRPVICANPIRNATTWTDGTLALANRDSGRRRRRPSWEPFAKVRIRIRRLIIQRNESILCGCLNCRCGRVRRGDAQLPRQHPVPQHGGQLRVPLPAQQSQLHFR